MASAKNMASKTNEIKLTRHRDRQAQSQRGLAEELAEELADRSASEKVWSLKLGFVGDVSDVPMATVILKIRWVSGCECQSRLINI